MSEPTLEATPTEPAEAAKAAPAEAVETEPAEAAKAEPAETEVAKVEPEEAAAKIDFERADLGEQAGEHLACGLCTRVITTEYWQSVGKVLCEPCSELVRATAAAARRGATLGKAFLLGGAAALGCGIGYAIFVGLTQIQFALVTIGIGWAIGRSIQRVTRGFGGRKHQVLAVVLTYFASSMGYLPSVLKAFSNIAAEGSDQGAAATTAPAAPAPSSAPTAAGTAAASEMPAPPPRETQPSAPGGLGLAASLVLAALFATLIMLAAPILEVSSGFSGLLGVLIIFFGLRTAWRVSKGVEATVTGPYKVAAPAEP
jgi:hypothetical protein